MSRRTLSLGLGLLAVMATTTPAFAQGTPLPTAATMATDFPACTKKTSDGDQELAKQKFIAARQDYEEGNDDSAINRFRNAYNYDCSKPELLLLISSAFEKKGDLESKKAALAALEVYTQRAPKDAPDMATTQAKIENLKKQIAAAPPPPSTTPPKEEEGGHSVVPWIVVGVGAAAAITGVVLHLTATYPEGCTGESETCSRGTDTAEEFQQRQSEAGDVRGRKIAGTVGIISGSALVVGGLVWHFLEPTGSKSSGKGRLTPAIAPGYAGLSYGLRF